MISLKAAFRCSLFALLLQAVAPAHAIDVPPPPAPTTPDTVNIGWMVFVPSVLTVKAGTTVTWVNVDDSNHRIKLPDGMGPRLDKGMTYQHTFTTPGTYHVECGIHGPRMSGTVVVQ
ncbi:MAG TPA: plastocyanin/azurin family copper-binding protein [Nevskia sp.]|nr:plastocyanin/azurin family copper-binding protein [Nevskia sp.]